MQPESGTYLRGIRRELMQAAEEQRAAGDELRALAYVRTAEAALQLLVRAERLPAIVTELLPALRALLDDTLAAMRALGIAPPATAAAAMREADAASSSGALIAAHDALGFLLADCMLALGAYRANPAAAALADRTGVAAMLHDQRLRDARAAAGEHIDAGMRPAQAAPVAAVDDAAITAFLRQRLPQFPDIRASGTRRQIGFNTKEIFFFEISGHPDWPRHAVLRRNREVDTVGNQVADEFELLDFLYRAGVPVPRPLIADDGNVHIARSFLISEMVAGKAQTLSSVAAGSVAAALEMAEQLGALHRLDPATLPRSRVLYPGAARERTLAMIDRFHRMMRGAWYEPSLTHEAAFAWLRAHVDRIGPHTVIVHADYDCRNLLFDGDRLTAILDWELTHVGHPAEDLAYCRPQIEQVMDWRAFLRRYVDCGGKDVRDEEVAYFEIYNDAFRVATMRSATQMYIDGRHTDILIGMAGLIEQPQHLGRVAQQLTHEGE